MHRIVVEAEAHAPYLLHLGRRRRVDDDAASFEDAVAEAAYGAAADVKARALVAFTTSGFPAQLISKFRPRTPILAFTPHEHVYRKLALYWGVQPRRYELIRGIGHMIGEVDGRLQGEGAVAAGDTLVFLAGTPVKCRARRT